MHRVSSETAPSRNRGAPRTEHPGLEDRRRWHAACRLARLDRLHMPFESMLPPAPGWLGASRTCFAACVMVSVGPARLHVLWLKIVDADEFDALASACARRTRSRRCWHWPALRGSRPRASCHRCRSRCLHPDSCRAPNGETHGTGRVDARQPPAVKCALTSASVVIAPAATCLETSRGWSRLRSAQLVLAATCGNSGVIGTSRTILEQLRFATPGAPSRQTSNPIAT